MTEFFLWWRFEGSYFIGDFKRGVENIWSWLPVIWKDRNYDHVFILEILKYKIENQSKYIERCGVYEDRWRDLRNMRACVNLIDLITSSFYDNEYREYHKVKYRFKLVDKKNGLSTIQSRQIEENFDLYFSKYPLIYKRFVNNSGLQETEEIKEKESIARNIASTNHTRAKRLLFKILEQEVEKWWG